MRIAGHRGNLLHAPESSRAALISAYTGGADVLEFHLQLTADDRLVLSHDATTDRLTGTPGRILDLGLDQLRGLDFSATFKPRQSSAFKYFPGGKRVLRIETFPAILEQLPEDAQLLIELRHESSMDPGRRDRLVRQVVEAIDLYEIGGRTVLYSKDAENLRLARRLRPSLRTAACDGQLPWRKQVELMTSLEADGLVVDLDAILAAGSLTEFGRALDQTFAQSMPRIGAIVRSSRQPNGFTEPEWRLLAERPWVWSISTDSLFDVAFVRRSVTLADEGFAGEAVNRDLFALGYAKANRFGNVYQRDGVHVEIGPYPPFAAPPTDPGERRLERIEEKLTYTAKDWPYYSGGGVGLVLGIRGDFSAEVDYTVDAVAQATTLEMAVLNVDPGAHQGKPPTSFREKDSFYDPHGAPPYVGVEHDENDGYRINWNLGSEYDNNQYGAPVGDGATPRAARLRLERRGAYFAAYYRNEVDARDWVCCGVARNDTLNPVVFLRCVGKRWRQEDPEHPELFLPVIPNHFVFRNLTVRRFPRSASDRE